MRHVLPKRGETEMAMIDERGAMHSSPCPAWVDSVSDGTLRRFAIGGCALFWVAIAVMVFA